jgi:anti-sigma B factor antagonist
MSLQVTLDQKSADIWQVTLVGSLDTDTAAQCEAQLQPILVAATKRIVINMAELDYISSAGIRVLAATTKKMKANEGSVAVTQVQPQIQKVLDIVKALPALNIFKDMAEADEYFDAMQKKVLDGD